MRRLFVLLSVLVGVAPTVVTGEVGEALTTCAAVRALTRSEGAEGRSVRLRGVVTMVPSGGGEVRNFTLDDGVGVWISAPPPETTNVVPRDIEPGWLVEVVGETAEGRFSPIVVARRVDRIGRAELPPPRLAEAPHLDSGRLDSQRVRLRGIVSSEEWVREGAHWELRLYVRSPEGKFTFNLVAAERGALPRIVDAEVTLTGVCLSFFNSRRQFLGARLYSNFPGDLQVDKPGPADPFAVPAVELDAVLAFSPAGVDQHRRLVRGVVTLAKPGEYLFLERNGAALRVNTRQADVLRPGDVVEASGFFDLPHHRAEMQEAVFRRIAAEAPPEPVEIRRRDAFVVEPQTIYAVPQDFDDRLVALEGTFLGMDERQGESLRINIMSDGALVSGELADAGARQALTALRPGSRVRVTGVCQMTYSAPKPVLDWPQPVEMRLLVRDARDVRVLAAASWWTEERLAVGLATLALVLCAVLAWVYLLRRQVAQRSLQLAEAMRARRDAAVEFDTVLRERSRLAADLHDTMEQSLTGMALQLEAGQALRATDPGRGERHLGLARQLLASSREDLRRSIWNLRANPLERLTLAAALREVAANAAMAPGIEIACETTGTERPIPDFVAGNLLLLAQEALTNALKHAEAKRVVMRLEYGEGRVSLEIRDDGRGFDPAKAAGPESGHFGLQGMRERVKRLGGRIEIRSAPGQGASIRATVTD